MKRKFLILIFLVFITVNVSAKDIDELFNEVAPNDVFTINAYKPKNAKIDDEGNPWYPELDFYPMHYMRMKYPNDVYYAGLGDCNDDLSECKLMIDIPGETENTSGEKRVSVIWQDDDNEALEKINQYAYGITNSKVKDDMNFSIYYVTDLEIIDFMNDLDKNDDKNLLALNYSSEFKEKVKNSDLTFYLDTRMGDDYEMYGFGGGVLVIMHKGIMGGLVSVGQQFKNTILIPDDTENTPEAYIAAAKERISKHLNRNDIKIEKVGKISEFVSETHSEPFDFSLLGNKEKMGDYYYRVTIGNESNLFVFVRDASILSHFDEVYNRIVPNNKFDLNAYKPDVFNEGIGDFYVESHKRNNYSDESYYITFNSCNKDLTTCSISVNIDEVEKVKDVSMVWKDADEGLNKIKDVVTKLIDNSDTFDEGNEMYYYDIEDMDIVNYFILETSEQCSIPDQIFRSSKKMKEIFNDDKLAFTFHDRLGGGTSMAFVIGGGLVISYDGVIGAHIDVAARVKKVIYVPDDMENNDEAIINYIKNRINNDKVKVEVVGKRLDYISEDDDGKYDFSNLGDESKMMDNYYKVSMVDAAGLQNYTYFVVIKDSSKIPQEENPEPVFKITYNFNGGLRQGESEYIDESVAVGIDITKESFIDMFTVTAPEGKELDAIEINGTRYELGSEYLLNKDTVFKYLWKDVKKEEKDEVVIEDSQTQTTVMTDSEEVPSDAKLTVIIVEKNTEEYKKIKNALKTEDFKAYDIMLNSETLGGQIKQLKNGKFKVTIFLGKEYCGKKMVAFYIGDNNKIEKYNVKVDENGYASFETKHFSTYIFADEENVDSEFLSNAVLVDEEELSTDIEETKDNTNDNKEIVPKTYDGITNYVMLLILSISGLFLIIKKRFN